MSQFDIYNVMGYIAVFLTLYSYARVQWRRDYAKRLNYSLLNLLATLFFGISLVGHWNLPYFINNTAWGFISAYGIYRCLKYMRRKPAAEA